jgi:hypothetical protein
MANPTTYFGWVMPTSTDLVTDLPADFNVFGQGVDTSLQDLLGGTTGQVLSKASNTNMDFTWIEQDDTTLSFNAQTGTTYTLVAADLGKLVTLSNAGAITLTVPPSVFTTGNIINIQQIGAGQVTFAQGAGVTITSTGATSTAPKITSRYGAATVICTGSNTFTIIGGLS